MAARREAPFGSWASPRGAELLAAATIRFGQLAVSGGSIFWSEGRPADAGRNVVVECGPAGDCADRNPPPYDARNRVHEYGGGAFAVGIDGELFFSHNPDQRLYRCRRGETPRPLTAAGTARFADAPRAPRPCSRAATTSSPARACRPTAHAWPG
jgi:hypothetical protein